MTPTNQADIKARLQDLRRLDALVAETKRAFEVNPRPSLRATLRSLQRERARIAFTRLTPADAAYVALMDVVDYLHIVGVASISKAIEQAAPEPKLLNADVLVSVLAETLRTRRCGTCADARLVPTDGPTKRKCASAASECYGWVWTVDHGCPWHR